jgi:hypothetical protein
LEHPRPRPDPAWWFRRSAAVLVVSAAAAFAAGAMTLWPARGLHRLAPGPRAKQSAPPDTPHSAGTRTAWATSDEVQRLLEQGQNQARAIESDLHRRSDALGNDPLSALGHALTWQAEDLERDLLAYRPAPQGTSDSFPNRVNHNRR